MLLASVVALLASTVVHAADQDGDGLRDDFESRWGVTSVDKADSDGDGVIDSAEDDDGDRLSNLGEQRFGTDPGRRDSDRDGRSDANEDNDHDGISNALEQDRRPIPVGLRPALGKAAGDAPASPGLCHTPPGSDELLPCEYGELSSNRDIVVFGDSHARQWLPALHRAGIAAGWRITQLTKSGCPSISSRVQVRYPRDHGRSCRRWRNRALAWITAERPEVVLISNRSRYTLVAANGKRVPGSRRPVAWRKAMARTLGALPSDATVIVLSDTPVMDGEPITCLKAHRQNLSACSTRRSVALASVVRKAERAAARDYGAKTLNLNDKICTYDPCPLVHGNILLWRDHAHLTATFIKRLSPTLQARVSWAAGSPLRMAARRG
jgi:hypothetical protein